MAHIHNCFVMQLKPHANYGRILAVCLQVVLADPGDAVILDGELVVWRKTRGVFEPFGGVRSAMNAARERVAPEHVRPKPVDLCCFVR